VECNQLLCDELKLSEETLLERYDEFGGIRRFVYEDPEDLNEFELNSAIGCTDFGVCEMKMVKI
jgi:hypothetical protein